MHEYLERFPGKEDALRYVLCSIAPESKDSEFTWKDFQARNNNELVAILGNFVNRAVVLTNKYYGGQVPPLGELTDYDRETLDALSKLPIKIGQSIEAYKFREALAEAMNMARLGNKYLADTEPWKVVKTDEQRVQTIMNISLQICASLSVVLEPFMPTSAQKIAGLLRLSTIDWSKAGHVDVISEGHQIGPASLLFEKIEDPVIAEEIERLENSKKESAPLEKQKDKATFDQFTALDIRVGKIIEAQPVKKAKKLLELKVDTGIDTRTIVSGIAEHYQPAELIGQQVAVLINLEPRKLRGVLSEGMILMAEDNNGKLVFVAPGEEMMNGAVIR